MSQFAPLAGPITAAKRLLRAAMDKVIVSTIVWGKRIYLKTQLWTATSKLEPN